MEKNFWHSSIPVHLTLCFPRETLSSLDERRKQYEHHLGSRGCAQAADLWECSRPDKGKGGKGGKGKSKKGGKGKERDEKAASKFEGKCTARRRDTRRRSAERGSWDIIAGTTQPSSGAPRLASTIPMQQVSQPTETWFINMIENSHGCKFGRSRIRVVGFLIWLDVVPNQLCQRSPTTAGT